ncbi:hypothetical protein BC332_33629 [Capsicum chinense]|nr:hypothetical protein BC332_33629 [Capsicum chinense]
MSLLGGSSSLVSSPYSSSCPFSNFCSSSRDSSTCSSLEKEEAKEDGSPNRGLALGSMVERKKEDIKGCRVLTSMPLGNLQGLHAWVRAKSTASTGGRRGWCPYTSLNALSTPLLPPVVGYYVKWDLFQPCNIRMGSNAQYLLLGFGAGDGRASTEHLDSRRSWGKRSLGLLKVGFICYIPNAQALASFIDRLLPLAFYAQGRLGSYDAKIDEECYLVDPSSSHMVVSKIKPCMYNRSNSRANMWNKPQLLENKRSMWARPIAAMIHDNLMDRTAIVPVMHHLNFCTINFRWTPPALADVAFRTPPAPYEKSKFLGSGGSIGLKAET